MSERPTWHYFTEAVCLAQAHGYELGRAAGLREAADERDADVLRERAAAVIRGAVASMGVKAARGVADTYPGARGPARGCAA